MCKSKHWTEDEERKFKVIRRLRPPKMRGEEGEGYHHQRLPKEKKQRRENELDREREREQRVVRG